MTVAFAMACILVLSVLGILLHPGWALMGYYVVAFLRPMELSPNLADVRLSLPLVAAALIGVMVQIVRHGLPKRPGIQPLIYAIMIAHFFLSAKLLESPLGPYLGHDRPVDSASLWRKFDIYFKMGVVVLIAARYLQDERWVKRAVGVIGFCGAFLAVWANYRYFVLHAYPITGPGPHIGRGGIFSDRNDFCMFLDMAIVMCWYMSTLTRRWWLRLAWLAAIPFLFHTVLLTEGRGGLLGAVAALGYIAWRSPHRKLMILANTGALVIAVVFFTSAGLLDRYGTITEYQEDASALGRLNAWRTGWRIMWGNPLFGAGLENFQEVFYDYADYRPAWAHNTDNTLEILATRDYEAMRARQAHNMWIQRGGETGIVGLLILLWFVASIPVDARRLRRWLAELRGRIPPEQGRTLLTLTHTVEGATLAYVVTGFFLSMEDFEGLYVIGALTACLTGVVRRLRTETAQAAGGETAQPTAAPTRPPPPRGLIGVPARERDYH